MGNWDYLSNRPFTTIAEDLLKCLKENLIEEIVFGLASWTKRKQNLPSVLNKVRIDEFNESFKKFSNKCSFINGDNEEIKDYWKRAMTVRPDFDIWILTLDPGNIKKEDFKLIYNNFDSDKTYILPDYTCNKYLSTKSNVHFVNNEISDLKNKDFTIEKNQKELNNFNKKAKFYTLGFITPIILYGVYLIIKKFGWFKRK